MANDRRIISPSHPEPPPRIVINLSPVVDLLVQHHEETRELLVRATMALESIEALLTSRLPPPQK